MQIHQHSATQLLAALEAGTLTSVAIVRALHARTDAVDAAVGGYVEEFREQALARAAAADAARTNGTSWGPLHGLPLSIKENIATKGSPQTLGITARKARLAPQDAVVSATLRDLGAIVLGKSNVPQLLLSMESVNPVYGRTSNPWNTARVPGGSSGGEAALIATGQSPLGIGTDIGGSIRIPCAWSGIAGFKPTVGRWSVRGSAGGIPGQEGVKAQMGPMARTVEDVVLAMQALDPVHQRKRDPRVPPLPPIDPSAVDLGSLRVGVYMDDGIFAPAQSVQRGVRAAADALRDAGAEVVEFVPQRSWELFETYFALVSADGAATALATTEGDPATVQLATLFQLARRPRLARSAAAALFARRGEQRRPRQLRAFGRKSVQALWRLHARRTELQRLELDDWAQAGIDLLIGPPTVTPAALHDETGDWSAGAWHTMRYNLLDLPAGVVPVSTVQAGETTRGVLNDVLDHKAARFEAGSEGMPVSVQVIGRPWEADPVLAAMAAIEAHARTQEGYPFTPIDPR